MPTKRNYKNELLQQSEKDKAIKLMINKQFIENIEKINRDVECIFICNCGLMGKKGIRQILGDCDKNNGHGFKCKVCARDSKNIKRGKKTRIYELYKNISTQSSVNVLYYEYEMSYPHSGTGVFVEF
jgi:hypothetical protein